MDSRCSGGFAGLLKDLMTVFPCGSVNDSAVPLGGSVEMRFEDRSSIPALPPPDILCYLLLWSDVVLP